jgi:hypothetical protein
MLNLTAKNCDNLIWLPESGRLHCEKMRNQLLHPPRSVTPSDSRGRKLSYSGPPWVGSGSPDGWDQIPRWAGGYRVPYGSQEFPSALMLLSSTLSRISVRLFIIHGGRGQARQHPRWFHPLPAHPLLPSDPAAVPQRPSATREPKRAPSAERRPQDHIGTGCRATLSRIQPHGTPPPLRQLKHVHEDLLQYYDCTDQPAAIQQSPPSDACGSADDNPQSQSAGSQDNCNCKLVLQTPSFHTLSLFPAFTSVWLLGTAVINNNNSGSIE